MNKNWIYLFLVAFLGVCLWFRWYSTKDEVEAPLAFDEVLSHQVEHQFGKYKNVFEDSANRTQYASFFKYWKEWDPSTKEFEFKLSFTNATREHWRAFDSKSAVNYIPNSMEDGQPTVVCLSSVFVGYISALGLEERIVGVDNLDFISNEVVRNKDGIAEVGNVGSINMELLLTLKPNYVLVDDFDLNSNLEENLSQHGIHLIRCNSFREKTPLARAEWIKFFGLLFGVLDKAEGLFQDTEYQYNYLKKVASAFEKKPSVIMNVMWGDQWTIPGGNSFQAKLIKDAGADYIFKNDTSDVTIHTGMETMMQKASAADYWLHLGSFKSKKDLADANSNYTFFKAFKQGNLYNNTKGTNPFGGIPYWESSGVYPDWVLADLISIFHPEWKVDNKHTFYFYERLE